MNESEPECAVHNRVAPDAKVIYQEAGEISMLKTRRTVLSYLPDLGYIGNANYWAKSMGLAR